MSNKYTKLAQSADKAFDGEYAEQLDALMGLSKDELAEVIPNTESKKTYLSLIKVVEEASKENLSQVNLVNKLKN